jgi:hypothetical protein
MSALSTNISYRISYFNDRNHSGNQYDDEVYVDDLENYEWFEMLTKKFINS